MNKRLSCDSLYKYCMELNEALEILEKRGYGAVIDGSLDESVCGEYLESAIQDVVDQLYDEELADARPELDDCGNVSLAYLKRFEYASPELKRAVKRAATKLSNDFKENGLAMNPWYIEMEIYDRLKCFAR